MSIFLLFLLYRTYLKNSYIMSKHGGKRAAQFVISKHPELFENNLIEMFPKIKMLTPKAKITKKNATLELLESLIEACNVTDALQTYDILKVMIVLNARGRFL